MKFSEILPIWLRNGSRAIERKSTPGEYYTIDGAEGGKYGIWKYDPENDDLIPNHGFTIDQIAADDWEFQN